MSDVKKAYQPIVELLEANADCKVKTIMPQIMELVTAKKGGGGKASTFHRNEAGEVVAIRDYYFGLWLPVVGPNAVEFGAKASSATGYNSMSKVGLSLWTKQQAAAKKAKEQLLADVASGAVPPENLTAELQAIEEARDFVAELPEGMVGYQTLEELREAEGL